MELLDVKEACSQFISKELHTTNCFAIQSLADRYACSVLLAKVNNYIESNFDKVLDCNDFYALDFHKVMNLIASDNIFAPNEEKVYKCVISWIKHDVENRNQFLPTLMDHVRLPLMSPDFLMNIKEPLLKAHPVCRKYITETLNHLNGRRPINDSSKTRARRRQKAILIMTVDMTVECYNFEDEEWSQICTAPTVYESPMFVNSLVYAFDAYEDFSNTVAIYDPSKNEWTSGPNMKTIRASLTYGVTVLNNCIYVIGGTNQNKDLNSAEVLDLSEPSSPDVHDDGSRQPQREWRSISNMSIPRNDVGVGVLNGFLYAVGGKNETKQELASVEAYDPNQDSWKKVADMKSRRFGAGVGALNGLLYAVGGFEFHEPVPYMGSTIDYRFRKDVECYNPDLDLWTYVSELNTGRCRASVFAHDGLLYVIGGDEGVEGIKSGDVYDPEANIWTILPANRFSIESLGACLIDKPCNI